MAQLADLPHFVRSQVAVAQSLRVLRDSQLLLDGMHHLRGSRAARRGDIIQLPRRIEPRPTPQFLAPALSPGRPGAAPAIQRSPAPSGDKPLRD